MDLVTAVLGSVLLSFLAAFVAFGVGYAVGRRKYDDVGAHATASRSGGAFLVFAAAWVVAALLVPDSVVTPALVGVARTLTFATLGYAVGWGFGRRA